MVVDLKQVVRARLPGAFFRVWAIEKDVHLCWSPQQQHVGPYRTEPVPLLAQRIQWLNEIGQFISKPFEVVGVDLEIPV